MQFLSDRERSVCRLHGESSTVQSSLSHIVLRKSVFTLRRTENVVSFVAFVAGITSSSIHPDENHDFGIYLIYCLHRKFKVQVHVCEFNVAVHGCDDERPQV